MKVISRSRLRRRWWLWFQVTLLNCSTRITLSSWTLMWWSRMLYDWGGACWRWLSRRTKLRWCMCCWRCSSWSRIGWVRVGHHWLNSRERSSQGTMLVSRPKQGTGSYLIHGSKWWMSSSTTQFRTSWIWMCVNFRISWIVRYRLWGRLGVSANTYPPSKSRTTSNR